MRSRRGLTLIELLVVISIVVALFAIVATVGPRFAERQRANRGASQLQGWLLIAKQRALRDYAPRGMRLLSPSGPLNAQYVTQLQYIEQPEAYQPMALDNTNNPVAANLTIQADYASVVLNFPTAVDQVSAVALAVNTLWPERAFNPSILPDVILEFYGRYPGQPRRVLSIQQPNSTSLALHLDQPFETPVPSQSVPPSKEYRLYRKAQPITGEPVLEMPRDIAIDISRDPAGGSNPTWYRTFPKFNQGGGQPFDILFDPAGQVIGATGRSSNRICLWVRDVSLGDPGPDKLPPGENTLITIYTRSGLIAAHPVDDGINPTSGLPSLTPGATTWNPFRFTQDGKSSGI